MTALRRFTDGGGGWGFMHWCPGCEEAHGIYVHRSEKYPGPQWSWNNDLEKPAFGPSVRCFMTEKDGTQRTLCHYFIGGPAGDKPGMIEFCPDSPHKLAGQTVALPPWPYAPGSYGGIDE